MTVSRETSFDAYWQATRERLEEEFERALPRFFERLPHLGAIRAVLAGGKRLRGCLVCLLNDALGGSWAAAIPRAMAVECVHAASLIHDDLVDGDTSRRDRAATWTTEGSRKAVLLGDLMFATALQRMVELGRDDGLAMTEAIAAMATGAYREPLVQADLVRLSFADRAGLYLELIHLKTGLLFGAAARLGALAAGQAAPIAALAFEYGARIGEAYQLADDLHDLVERAGDGPPMPTELAQLGPVLWHFCPHAHWADETLPLAPDHAARLSSGMLAAMEQRLLQASAAAHQLPSGPQAALLRAAPHHIVRAMRVGGH